MDDADLSLLRNLLREPPVAALATLHRGEPAVSMVPFALGPGGQVLIHVSRLSTHTADMLAHPGVSLLAMAAPGQAETPLALPRVSLQGEARPLEAGSPGHAEARAVYLAKLPDAEPLFDFADFSLFAIQPTVARLVAGFGRAHTVTGERLRTALEDAT